MKINYYALVSRSLIALLFVMAGIQKVMTFGAPGGSVEFIKSLDIPLALLVTIIVIIIEIPVALAFAWGYKVSITGGILAGFTILATLIVHKSLVGLDMVMALKNLAIIGGIMLAIKPCACTTCTDCKENKHVHKHG